MTVHNVCCKKNYMWRHISSHVIYFEKRPVLKVFSTTFPIKWTFKKLSSVILKIFKNANFIDFLKTFKIVVESSVIAHSIGNFIPKNIKTGHFLIRPTVA